MCLLCFYFWLCFLYFVYLAYSLLIDFILEVRFWIVLLGFFLDFFEKKKRKKRKKKKKKKKREKEKFLFCFVVDLFVFIICLRLCFFWPAGGFVSVFTFFPLFSNHAMQLELLVP